MLYHPRDDLPYCLQTDVSDVGLGAQLFQVEVNIRRPIVWASRPLLDREQITLLTRKKRWLWYGP